MKINEPIKLKISLRAFFSLLGEYLVMNIFIISIGLPIIIIEKQPIWYMLAILIVYGLVSFGIVALILHFQYLKNERHKCYLFTKEALIISVKGIVTLNIIKSEVEEIRSFSSKAKNSGGIDSTSIVKNYSYLIIKLKNQKSIVITCLVSNELNLIVYNWCKKPIIGDFSEFIPFIKKEFYAYLNLNEGAKLNKI